MKEIKEKFKKGIGFGLKAVNISMAKVKNHLRHLVRDGYLSNKEARAFLRQIVSFAGKEQKRVSKIAQIEAKKALKEIGVVSINEAKLMKKRLKKLEGIVRKKGMRIVGKIVNINK